LKRISEERPVNKDLTLLDGGKDSKSIKLSDYTGDPSAEPGQTTGLAAFKEIDEISIICAPNENDISGLTDAVIEHCELLKDRFAVIQAKQNAGPIADLIPTADTKPADSKYAAFYYPWVKIIDPLTQSIKLIPPGGHIVGIYARSDTERGVHKAPANEVVRGISGLQLPLTKGKQEILNPRGVNCIRTFRGRGISVGCPNNVE
jgi:phage tail sheath protein FI